MNNYTKDTNTTEFKFALNEKVSFLDCGEWEHHGVVVEQCKRVYNDGYIQYSYKVKLLAYDNTYMIAYPEYMFPYKTSLKLMKTVIEFRHNCSRHADLISEIKYVEAKKEEEYNKIQNHPELLKYINVEGKEDCPLGEIVDTVEKR